MPSSKIQGEAEQHAPDQASSNETLARKSAQGGIITLVSQICRVAIQIVGVAVVSRLCSPSDFGLLAMAATVTGFISLFTDLGLSAATIQRQKIDQQVISTLFFINLAMGMALFAVAALASPVAAMLFHDQRVIPLIIALGAAIPISAAGAQHAALLMRDMRWIAIQGVGIVSQLIGLIVVISLALTLDQPYMALAAQSVVASLLSTAGYWILSGWRPSFVSSIRQARSEIGFGAYLSGFNFVNYMHDQLDDVLLGWRWGSVELGFYSRAYSLLQMPLNLINGAISQAALPSLSRLATRHEDWTRAFMNLLAASACGSMAMCCTLFVASDALVSVLLGSQWAPVATLFRYLIVASIFGSASAVCGSAFISLGKTKVFFYWGLFASPVFAISYIIGLPWAAMGVAVAYSVAMATLAPVYLAVTARVAGFSFFQAGGRIVPFMLAAGVTCALGVEVMAGVTVASPVARLFVAIAVAIALYLALAVAAICLLPIYGDFRRLVIRLARRGAHAGTGNE